MLDWLRELLFSQAFMPHGHCYFWRPEMVWLHALSDGLIALAYFAIPFSIVSFVRRRRDLEFKPLFVMFGVFILSCGVTHLLSIWTIWYPAYWLDGVVKAFTAVVSLLTAWAFWRMIPHALELPSPSQLQVANQELRRARDELEERVKERTAEIQSANEALHAEMAERSRAELWLAESERRYRAIVEHAGDAILVHDPTGRILDVNERACATTGYSRDELLAMTKEQVEVGIDASALHDAWTHAGAEQFLTLAGKHRRKDGSIFPVEVRLAAAEIQGQKVIVALVRDVTERLALEARLQQAEKMESIAMLVGGIAHDFNNILAAILGYADLASLSLAEGRAPADLEGDLAEIAQAGRRARDLVAQLLVFSRTQAVQAEPVDVEATVGEVLRLLRSTLPTTLTMAAEFEPDLPSLVIAPVHLHQILLNLCVNARDAMAGRGRIRVTARRQRPGESATCASCGSPVDRELLVLAVADEGPGLGPTMISRIFEPFFTTKEIGKGTGMGLAVVHGIVHSAGGHIRVVSEVGHGAEVQVLMPAGPQGRAPQVPSTTAMALPRLRGRVLVVDDEATIARFVGTILQKCGCDVTICASGAEALAHCPAGNVPFDLVLTDQTMPGMTGAELAVTLLAMRPGLPIVLCTGYSADLDRVRSEQIGVRRFLHKPVTTAQLLETVAELLPGSQP